MKAVWVHGAHVLPWCWVPPKSLPDKPQSQRKLPAKTVHRRPRKAAPPSPSRATTSALVQLGTTLQALGAQLVQFLC